MSMPKFPEINPDITCEYSLNMILASIAMEELALSHIINAEGEKLQYVIGTLENSIRKEPDVDEVLKVNQSITNLLDSVAQNQMILKNKMDKALYALADICPEHTKPIQQKCKCCASFKEEKQCKLWYKGSSLGWNIEHVQGECIHFDTCDRTKICLKSKGKFVINFAVNVIAKSKCKSSVAICLQMINDRECTDMYTVHSIVHAGVTSTISMGGIIIENFEHSSPSSLSLKLVSSEILMVESSMISIMEI